MQKITIAAISGLIALTLATPLGATLHEDCMGIVTEIPLGPESLLYIDDRSGGKATLNHWFYLESGDQQGLQTGGISPDHGLPEDPIPYLSVDTCDHHLNRDILLI